VVIRVSAPSEPGRQAVTAEVGSPSGRGDARIMAAERRGQSARVSVVAPFYDEERSIGSFFERLLPVLESITPDFEVVCVDDGSRDRTFELLAEQHRRDPRIKVLALSRNFGKELALSAGLDFASGDAVIPIDADLQDPPELIGALVQRWCEGFEVVLAVRSERPGDSWIRRVSARLFYQVMGRLSEVPVPAEAGDFRLLDRRVVEAFRQLPERTRFTKGLLAWLGFRQARVEYSRPVRAAGSSRWRWWSLWNFALEGIFSFTTWPLRIWSYLGGGIAALAIAYALFIILRTLILGIDVPGFASIVVLISFFGGLNLIGLGIIGEYLGRVFIETKARPRYLIAQSLGFEAMRPQPQALRTRSSLERVGHP
jgi:polyisoprenyl-phosphate glycosyltransferase